MATSGYVLDTHALIFYAGGEMRKLGRKARAAFASYERGETYLVVPIPVVFEAWLLHLGGHIETVTSFERWWTEIADEHLALEEMTDRDICSAASLAWEHRDPFDRLIVAIARRLDLPLLTRDATIGDWAESSGEIRVEW